MNRYLLHGPPQAIVIGQTWYGHNPSLGRIEIYCAHPHIKDLWSVYLRSGGSIFRLGIMARDIRRKYSLGKDPLIEWNDEYVNKVWAEVDAQYKKDIYGDGNE